MNDNNNDAWCKAEAYDTSWALERHSAGSLRAFDEGMYDALEEIRKRGEELKSAAFDGPPTPASRKAEGALLLWRKALTPPIASYWRQRNGIAHWVVVPASSDRSTNIRSSGIAIVRATPIS